MPKKQQPLIRKGDKKQTTGQVLEILVPDRDKFFRAAILGAEGAPNSGSRGTRSKRADEGKSASVSGPHSVRGYPSGSARPAAWRFLKSAGSRASISRACPSGSTT
jgi:hypothetical protein